MSDLNRRLTKVEKALNVDKEQRVAEMVYFGDGPLTLRAKNLRQFLYYNVL